MKKYIKNQSKMSIFKAFLFVYTFAFIAMGMIFVGNIKQDNVVSAVCARTDGGDPDPVGTCDGVQSQGTACNGDLLYTCNRTPGTCDGWWSDPTDCGQGMCVGERGYARCETPPAANEGDPTWCAVFDCPNGDTSGDGMCLTGGSDAPGFTGPDQGATMSLHRIGSCPSAPASGCGQIDYFKGDYGQWRNANGESNLTGFNLNFSGGTFPNCGTPPTKPEPEPDPVPNVHINKSLDGRNNPFRVNETVPFNISIVNTGNSTFDVVRFTDRFDRAYLQFVSGEATYSRTGNTVNITNRLQTSNVNNQHGHENSNELRLPDLTQVFGRNMAPGESYTLKLQFRALKDGNTENIAIVNADGLSRQDNQIVVIVSDPNPEPEPTPGVSITKNARNNSNGTKSFLVGQRVKFDIRITNSGPTNLTRVRFRDNYNTVRLQFLNGSIRRHNANGTVIGTVADIKTILNVNNANNGLFEISNIAGTSLGGLRPGEYYAITVEFSAKAQGSATNVGIVNARDENNRDIPERRAQDTVHIGNISTDI